MKEAILYKKLEDGKIQCVACNHFCTINDGMVGVCGVRRNIKGRLFLLTYNKAIAVHVDPVEKKPLFHFLPGEYAYSFGTAGCNFRCANCQNFDISQMFERKGKVDEYKYVEWGQDYSPKEIVSGALKNNCSSIAYTYNEPTVFTEYALETMKLARKEKLKNIWVSNGFMSNQTIDAVLPYLDAVNVDIKSFDEKFYRTNCGARLQPVLDNCKRFVKEGVWLEITTLVIPTLSDGRTMLRQIADFIKEELGDWVPWHVSAFSGEISWKLQHLPSTKPETVKEVYDVGKKEGLRFVYAGNVWDVDLESTYCPKCKALLIERRGYSVEIRNLKVGACAGCGEKIQGIWE
jgi:pyruvate formate lyase activating enzyme